MAYVNYSILLALLLVILLTQVEGIRAHKKKDVFQSKTEESNKDEQREAYETIKEELRGILSKAKPVEDELVDKNADNGIGDLEDHPLNYIPNSRKRDMDLAYEESHGDDKDQVLSLRSSGIHKEFGSADYRTPASDADHGHAGHEHTTEYLNEWAVHVEGGPDLAKSLAADLGYIYKGKIGDLEDLHRLVKADHPAVQRRAAPHLTQHLHQQKPVVWAEQQFSKRRTKRGYGPQDEANQDPDIQKYIEDILVDSDTNRNERSIKTPEQGKQGPDQLLERVKKDIMDYVEEPDSNRKERSLHETEQGRQGPDQLLERVKKDFMDYIEELEEMAHVVHIAEGKEDDLDKSQDENSKKIEKRSEMAYKAKNLEDMFDDEFWYKQWYLYDSRTQPELPELDLRVVPVWEKGITGKGIRISVLDDGLEWNHTDILPNYDSEISCDVNSDDSDPMPHYGLSYSNSHGTRCAGEIAMSANNQKCGVGVAHGASIGGVRMLDGSISDRVEATALSHALHKVDVISCSWGPTDDGTHVEGPGKLARMALKKGVTKGRNGKGIVYVWAAGNGGSAMDNCNCDGYTSSIYTLSIGSASETGLFPWYGERCASTLATAYSSGAYSDQKIVTTDLEDDCTLKFSGTSAAAPLAAGIVALALEVNPELTWRDVQHAVVWTSDWDVLAHNGGWQTNGRGLKFNPRFGFGLLNAEALVAAVKDWPIVPEKTVCHVEETKRSTSALETGGSVEIELESEACVNNNEEVGSLEHLEVILTANYTNRGALTINITSPMGTTTKILTERPRDNSEEGFSSWAFMSVHTWGEDPKGTWKLTIEDKTDGSYHGFVGEVYLRLHGTKKTPEHMSSNRTYNERVIRPSRVPVTEDKNLPTSENLKSLTWEKLKEKVLQESSISSLTDLTLADLDLLMETGQLANAIKNTAPEKENNQMDLNLIQSMVQDFRK